MPGSPRKENSPMPWVLFFYVSVPYWHANTNLRHQRAQQQGFEPCRLRDFCINSPNDNRLGPRPSDRRHLPDRTRRRSGLKIEVLAISLLCTAHQIDGDFHKIYFKASQTPTITDGRWLAFNIELPPMLRIQAAQSTGAPPKEGVRFCDKLVRAILTLPALDNKKVSNEDP
jgi:hypothetical protein